MSRRVTNWLALLSACCVLALGCSGAWTSEAQAADLPVAEIGASPQLLPDQLSGSRQAQHAAPEKAYALLETLQQRHGIPLPGYVGGKIFHNRERRLPRGRYKEYDVNQKVPGRSRDAERLVIEQDSGKAYYTDDHYRTFLPLN